MFDRLPTTVSIGLLVLAGVVLALVVASSILLTAPR